MDFTKVVEMGKRIYNNNMLVEKDDKGNIKLSDEQAIKALVEKTFNSNGQPTTLENLRSFNQLIVETGNVAAQPRVDAIIGAVSDYKTVGRFDTVVYQVPKQAKITMAMSATGSGVDFVRITPGKKQQPARPVSHQFGVYYDIDLILNDPVNEFRNAVNYVADYKVQYIMNKIMELTAEAVGLGTVPTGQQFEGANITFEDFRGIENKLLRYGRNATPILLADRNLIDALALEQIKTGLGVSGANSLLATDQLREELLRSNQISKISRTIAIATDNPFIDNNLNDKVHFAVNEGIMVAGGDKSPFMIREYGQMTTAEGLPDVEDERVNMKITLKMDITLLYGAAIGFIKDSAITL